MKSNKTLIATLAVGLLTLGVSAFADDTNTPPAKPEAHAGWHGRGPNLDALNLTDDQKPKVEAILKEQGKKMRALRDDPNFASLSREDKMAKFKALRDDTDTKLKAVLTADQYKQWEKMTQRGMRNRGEHKPATPPPQN